MLNVKLDNVTQLLNLLVKDANIVFQMIVITNAISISRKINNMISEEEIDIELLKYSSYWRPTLKRLALEGDVISEVYKELYDLNHFT